MAGLGQLNSQGTYGLRADGTVKGDGYFGPIPMNDGSGSIMTEMGIGVTFDGRQVEIPSVVPTLTKQELEHIRSGKELTPEIVNKAADHAIMRMRQGRSVWASPTDTIIDYNTLK